MGKLIVIEGLDGYGKTTIAQNLAKRIGAKYIKSDTERFKELSDEQKESMHPKRRLLYYLNGYFDISEIVRQSKKDEIFVTDRYITSMQIYNGQLIGEDITEVINYFDLITPIFQILLVGDEKSRKKRVNVREQKKSDWDEKIQRDEFLRNELKERYYHFCREFPVVINTGRSIDETILEINSLHEGRLIDLHIHSSVVDGVLSPTEIVKRASNLGLKAISITDHNSIEGLQEGKRAANKFGIEFVSGIEISAKEQSHNVHILGYFIDETNQFFQKFVRYYSGLRRKSLEEKCVGLQELGFDISLLSVLLESPQRFIGKKNLAYNILQNPTNRKLVKKFTGDYKSMNEGVSKFKQKIFEDENAPLRGCKTPAANITEAIQMIHSAGGLAFLAHPHIRSNKDAFDKNINYFIEKEIDGIEVYTTNIEIKTMVDFLVLANKSDLLVSGGSNFHQDWNKEYTNNKEIKIGAGINNALKVPYYYLEKMKKRMKRF